MKDAAHAFAELLGRVTKGIGGERPSTADPSSSTSTPTSTRWRWRAANRRAFRFKQELQPAIETGTR